MRRWDELGAAFHEDGDRTETAARRMWADHQAELSRRLPWSGEQLAGQVGYLERARREH